MKPQDYLPAHEGKQDLPEKLNAAYLAAQGVELTGEELNTAVGGGSTGPRRLCAAGKCIFAGNPPVYTAVPASRAAPPKQFFIAGTPRSLIPAYAMTVTDAGSTAPQRPFCTPSG